nr:MAG: hypothetical protein [Podoviridae sp. ctka020]
MRLMVYSISERYTIVKRYRTPLYTVVSTGDSRHILGR